ncbi:BID domain-containing T4SS effector [Bartonella sp. B39]
MKKNRPSPSPHTSVQELIKYYEESSRKSSEVKSHHAASTSKNNQPTPVEEGKKSRFLEENPTSSSTEYERALVITQNLTEAPMREKATGSEQQEATVHKTTSLKSTINSLSQAEITQLIANDPWIVEYQRDISYWCKEVFGKKDILQKQVSEIQKNHLLGRDLSWQLEENPASIHKFAGINVCGVKNKTRKNAERNLTILCQIVDCYTDAIENAKENLLRFPQEQLERYEKIIGSEGMLQILQSQHCSGKGRGFLTNTEVTDIARQNSTVKAHQEQIEHWSRVVFGKSNILQKRVENILETPSKEAELVRLLEVDPQSIHNLAGKNVCGFKNKVRKNAEVNISQLVSSINNFTDAVKQAKESILQNHQAQQEHCEPSAKLAESLHKQQDLSRSFEDLLADQRHEVSETSRHTHERAQSVQPHKALGKKALAFAS